MRVVAKREACVIRPDSQRRKEVVKLKTKGRLVRGWGNAVARPGPVLGKRGLVDAIKVEIYAGDFGKFISGRQQRHHSGWAHKNQLAAQEHAKSPGDVVNCSETHYGLIEKRVRNNRSRLIA
jgi:hypothetical protein